LCYSSRGFFEGSRDKRNCSMPDFDVLKLFKEDEVEDRRGVCGGIEREGMEPGSSRKNVNPMESYLFVVSSDL
jgi:hypothetical protein